MYQPKMHQLDNNLCETTICLAYLPTQIIQHNSQFSKLRWISECVFDLQLWMHAGKQNRIHHISQLDRRKISRKPDNQLGCDSVGEPPPRTLDRAGHPGHNQPHRGSLTSLSRIQGKRIKTILISPTPNRRVSRQAIRSRIALTSCNIK